MNRSFGSFALVLVVACALGAGALAAAQDASPPASPEACPSPAAGTPAGDMATPDTATPDASPAACPSPEAGGIVVQMVDIAFSPKELTIPADTDVTIELPNNGVTVHNFNIDALGIQSGDVAPGSTTTVTINAPAGTYEFYCSIPGHAPAGMVGTLTVQ